MHGNFFRRIDADANLIAFNADDFDGDVVADMNDFVRPSSEDEHKTLLVVLRDAQISRDTLDGTIVRKGNMALTTAV